MDDVHAELEELKRLRKEADELENRLHAARDAFIERQRKAGRNAFGTEMGCGCANCWWVHMEDNGM